MKKHFFAAVFMVLLAIILQSCSVNTDTMYFKDATSTTQTDVDFREMLQVLKSQSTEKEDKADLDELEKLPKTYTSLYDMEKAEGKKVSTNPDSIRLMKKIFVKGNYTDKELSGISMKFDRFSNADYTGMKNLTVGEHDKLPGVGSFGSWNGKTLTLDTEKLNIEEILKTMDTGETGAEEAKAMMEMMLKNITSTIRFENKIISIKGQHDWVQKVDDKTVRIVMDIAGAAEKKTIKADPKIIITTE